MPGTLLTRSRQHMKRPLMSLERWLYAFGLLRFRKLLLPHFLCLGSGQSGTTWLHENLSMHPHIRLPDIKETHYFSRKFDRWWLTDYAANFANGEDMVRGEITPGYNTLRRDRIAWVRRLIPRARLILIIRNPVDRAWSATRRVISKMAAVQGITFDEMDDSEFINYMLNEWAYRPERGMAGAFEPGLLEGQYSRVIGNWLAQFDEEQLLIVFFDEISRDPDGLLGKVCRHIGVDASLLPKQEIQKVVNANPTHRIPERFRTFLVELYADEMQFLQDRFGKEIDAAWGWWS